MQTYMYTLVKNIGKTTYSVVGYYCIKIALFYLAATFTFMQIALVLNVGIYSLTSLACNNPYMNQK